MDIVYLVFSLVIYHNAGIWLSMSAFDSASALSKIPYGVAIPGLVIGFGIYQDVAANYVFVWLT